jgi:mannose-6-phosphate isomerase-like protein (cupin superfamily)
MKFRFLFAPAAFIAFSIASEMVAAQSPQVDHITQARLRTLARGLSPKAQANGGSASDKLADYPNHYTMIALRQANGGAEIHENFADIFMIVEGRATLLTGGTVVDSKSSGPGEIHGTSLAGATQQALNKGDIVHIPAGVPHQLLLPHGGVFAYFVIKVKEK